MQERRQQETISGRVNADGSIATGDGFTVQFPVPGTGTYNFTFAPGFRLTGFAFAPLSGNSGFVSAMGERTLTLQTQATPGGAAAAVAFTFIATGVQQ